MKHRWIGIVFAAALSIFSLINFFSLVRYGDYSSEKPYPMLIGISHANLIEPWYIAMNEEIMRAAAEHDDIRLIIMDADSDDQRQKTDVANLIAYGVDLLIVICDGTDDMSQWLADTSGTVPIIALGRNKPQSGFKVPVVRLGAQRLFKFPCGAGVVSLERVSYTELETGSGVSRVQFYGFLEGRHLALEVIDLATSQTE